MMLTRRTSLSFMALLVACSTTAMAQQSPQQALPLPPSRPVEFGRVAPVITVVEPVKVEPVRPAGLPVTATRRQIIERVDAALNSLNVLTAEFVQLSGNKRVTGQLYIQKPGKLRFDYDPPSPLEIIADGSSVAVRDRKLATQDIYPIGQTPLKFLTRDKIDLERDLTVTGTRVDPDRVVVSVEDKSTFGGTSRLILFFDQPSMVLRQWSIVDPQGYEVTVTLNSINMTKRPDPKIFVIDFQKIL